MPRKNKFGWIEKSIGKENKTDHIKIELIRFWKEFYDKYLEMLFEKKNQSNGTQDDDNTKSIKNEDDSSMN